MNLKRQAGAIVAAAVLLAPILSGCNKIDDSTVLTQQVLSGDASSQVTLENSSQMVSSDLVSSQLASSAAPPAKAPEQPITQDVTKDPEFKPTEEDKKEDPQNHPTNQQPADKGDSELGNNDVIVIPNPPASSSPKPPSSSSSASSSKPVPPSSSSNPSSGESGANGSSSNTSDGSSSEGSSSNAGSSSNTTTSSTSPDAVPPAGYTGWWDTNGKRYCYVNGKKLTGWQNISSSGVNISPIGYYFDEDGVLSSTLGIDVSVWNKTIDWKKVKADGIEFVFIRAGYRGYGTGKVVIDSNFVQNIKGASAAGLKVGVYFFSQAINGEEGAYEAEWTLNAIQDYPNVEYVAIDTEKATGNGDVGRADNISVKDRTDAMVEFAKTVRAAGKKPLIYASASWFDTKLDLNRLTDVEKWLASWTLTVKWKKPFSIWQNCSDGKVNGIQGNVDRNAWKIVK